MRVARVGYLRLAFTIGAALAFAAPAAASAATTSAGRPSFAVTISPEYTTAGEPTTFLLTVVNTSSPAGTVGSLKLTPPAGFTALQPAAGTPLRAKTQVRNQTLSLRRISLKPGRQAKLSITATAPATCGGTLLHWTAQGFKGAKASGKRLALRASLSQLGITVLCPAAAACGDGGPPCSTSLVTSNSTYGVVSNAPSGTLNQTVNVGNRLTCGSYRFRDPNWYDSLVVPPTVQAPPATPISIVDSVTYTIRNTRSNGIGFCLGVGYEFTTASGTPAPATALPNGKPGFVGLLPRCSNSKPPCISSISQQPDPSSKVGFDALMGVQIPENGDPWGGG